MSTESKNQNSIGNKLRVYFDGLCILCSREIDHYRHQRGADQIDFIDICSLDFDAKSENLDPYQIHKVMHAKLPDGTLATRVQAFIEIWNRLPRYQALGKIAKLPFVNKVLELGYSGFVRIRPLLPRKGSSDCSSSPYCEKRDLQ